MQHEIYVWLKTIVLQGEPHEDVVSIFEKFKKVHCGTPQDVLNAEINRNDLEDKMSISYEYSIRIMKYLKNYSGPLPTPPDTSPSFSSSSAGKYYCGTNPIHLDDNNSNKVISRIIHGHVKLIDPLTNVNYSQQVVIKVSKSSGDIQRERRLLDALNEINNCRAIKIYNSPDDYLVLDKYDHDLRFMMKPTVSVQSRRVIIPQIISAVLFLHSHSVAHCDLKPGNILMKRDHNGVDWTLVICDFDNAVDLTSKNLEIVNDGTYLKYSPGWVSPEVFNGKQGMRASLEIDLFHLGLLIEMLTRSVCKEDMTVLPCEHNKLNEIFNPLCRNFKEEELDKRLTCRGSYAEIVRRLCSRDPKQRGTIEEVSSEDITATAYQKFASQTKEENMYLKKDIKSQLGNIHQCFNSINLMSLAHHHMLRIMEARGNILPTKFIIVPSMEQVSSSSWNIVKKLKQKARGGLWNKVRLFFVCDISEECAIQGGPKQKGYKLYIPNQALKILLPVLAYSAAILKTVLQIYGVPGGVLPNLLPDLPDNDIVQYIMDSIPKAEDVAAKAHDICSDKSLVEEENQLAAIQEGQVDVLYRLIQKSEGCEGQPLTGWEPKYTGLVKACVSAEAHGKGATGSSRWVLPQHKNLYEEHGDEARELILNAKKS